jgi:hypothetical protein
MPPYADNDGDSGVTHFECGDDSITVTFRGGARYLYNYAVTGRDHVEQMKVRALAGDGLNAYISRHVRKRYAAKLN